MITLTFFVLVASFLLGIDYKATDLTNRNNNYTFIYYILVCVCSTILFHHFFIKTL